MEIVNTKKTFKAIDNVLNFEAQARSVIKKHIAQYKDRALKAKFDGENDMHVIERFVSRSGNPYYAYLMVGGYIIDLDEATDLQNAEIEIEARLYITRNVGEREIDALFKELDAAVPAIKALDQLIVSAEFFRKTKIPFGNPQVFRWHMDVPPSAADPIILSATYADPLFYKPVGIRTRREQVLKAEVVGASWKVKINENGHIFINLAPIVDENSSMGRLLSDQISGYREAFMVNADDRGRKNELLEKSLKRWRTHFPLINIRDYRGIRKEVNTVLSRFIDHFSDAVPSTNAASGKARVKLSSSNNYTYVFSGEKFSKSSAWIKKRRADLSDKNAENRTEEKRSAENREFVYGGEYKKTEAMTKTVVFYDDSGDEILKTVFTVGRRSLEQYFETLSEMLLKRLGKKVFTAKKRAAFREKARNIAAESDKWTKELYGAHENAEELFFAPEKIKR